MRRTVPVGGFAPDAHDFGQLHLERCKNLNPVHGEMVPIHTYATIGKIADTEEINSGYCHVATADLNVQTARAKDTNTNGGGSGWYVGAEATVGDLHPEIDEVTPDDSDFIQSQSSAQNPTLAICKIELDDIEDPTVLTDHKLTVRVRAQYNPDTFTAATSYFVANIYHFDGASTWTKVGTADLIKENNLENNTWYTFTGTLDATVIDPPLSAGADYDKLYMYFGGNMVNSDAPSPIYLSAVSTEEEDGEWESPGGGDPPLANIEYDSGYAADSYIITKPLSEDEEAEITFGMDSIPVYIKNSEAVKVGWKAIASSSGDVKLKFELINDETEVAIWEEEAEITATDWASLQNDEFTATTGAGNEVELYNDTKDLCKLKLTATATAASSATSYRPTGDIYNGWESGNPAFYTKINDDPYVDSTYVEGTVGRIEPTFNNLVKPASLEGIKVLLRMALTSGNDGSVRLTITDGVGGEFVTSLNNINGSSYKNYYVTIPQNAAEDLDWDETWEVDIKINGTNKTYRLSELAILAETEGITASVSELYLYRDVKSNYAVSWAKFTVPDVTDNVRGDQMRIYGGSVDKLLQVKDLEDGNIEDVTSADGAYGQVNEPSTWDFCSWGGNVIAVNYEDDMQWMDLENGATVFTDLLASNSEPNAVTDVKAKYCAVVQNNLVVGNINHADYFSYSVGWSHFEDPQRFSAPSYTYLSDFQNLRQTPGEVTGIIGGDFGIITKRNSIYRMSYMGPPLMYRFDVIARGVGTAYPQSIVTANDITYWWGDNAFYGAKGGQPPQPISDGYVSRMMTDQILDSYTFDADSDEMRAFFPHRYDTSREYDSSIIGTYDKTTGLIWWVYTRAGDTAGSHYKTGALTYSVNNGQWGSPDFASFVDLFERVPSGHSSLHISVPVGLENRPETPLTPATTPMPGIVYWSREWDGGSNVELWRNAGEGIRPVNVRTSVLMPEMLGLESGSRFTVRSIRPVWSNTNEHADVLRDVTFTLYGSESLEFDASTSSASSLSSNTDVNGWYAFMPISGASFKLDMYIPAALVNADSDAGKTSMVPGLIAFQVEFDRDGDF